MNPKAFLHLTQELEHEKERLEIQEFEARLQARDQERTKKPAEQKLSKEEQEEDKRRRVNEGEDHDTVVDKLREYARQEYLVKRKDQKITELR